MNNKKSPLTKEDMMIIGAFGCLLAISYKVGFKMGSKEGINLGSSVAYERILQIMMR